MTPEEQKAKELIEKFESRSWSSYAEGYESSSRLESAKDCALFCIDEIMAESSSYCEGESYLSRTNFWQEVKTAIQNYKP